MCVCLQNFENGRSRGIAHVRMESQGAVDKILSQRNHMIEGYEVCYCATCIVRTCTNYCADYIFFRHQ